MSNIITKVTSASDVGVALRDLKSELLLAPRQSLPKPGRDCLDTPYCELIGQLGCASALRPSVITSMNAVDERGVPIDPTLDNINAAKRVSSRLFLFFSYSIPHPPCPPILHVSVSCL
jgi:hypothetical protein